jgi:hypothetical protein
MTGSLVVGLHSSMSSGQGAGRPWSSQKPVSAPVASKTYTGHVDHTLTESALPDLAARLDLPDGWQFKAQTLSHDLTITTNGLAHIVPDKLANMYQGCVDGVNNFDPLG